MISTTLHVVHANENSTFLAVITTSFLLLILLFPSHFLNAGNGIHLDVPFFLNDWPSEDTCSLEPASPIKPVIPDIYILSLLLLTRGVFFFRLLHGIDEERKRIHRGIVETVGSSTFAKTLEYKEKGPSGN